MNAIQAPVSVFLVLPLQVFLSLACHEAEMQTQPTIADELPKARILLMYRLNKRFNNKVLHTYDTYRYHDPTSPECHSTTVYTQSH